MKDRKNESTVVNCLIIDDEAPAADALAEKLSSVSSQLRILDKINDPKQALTNILLKKPDLVFLDIQMPGMSGFDIMEALSHTDVRPFVIFVTGFDQFAIQAIRASAFDYLLKPVDDKELILAVERFLSRFKEKKQVISYHQLLEQTAGKKIRFNTTGGFIMMNPQDIVYIQADWNYSEIHLGKEKHEVVTMNLGSIEEILPQGKFARINRSVIINLAYLEKVQRGKRLCILRKDGIAYEFKIPIMRIRYLEGLV